VHGQDWTCDECAEGGVALGAYASTPDAIEIQKHILLAEVCPQAPDVEYCRENLPGFWGLLSPIIMNTHYQHICDDLEECSPSAKVKSKYQAFNMKQSLSRHLFHLVKPVLLVPMVQRMPLPGKRQSLPGCMVFKMMDSVMQQPILNHARRLLLG
jgi:hypothetical protein